MSARMAARVGDPMGVLLAAAGPSVPDPGEPEPAPGPVAQPAAVRISAMASAGNVRAPRRDIAKGPPLELTPVKSRPVGTWPRLARTEATPPTVRRRSSPCVQLGLAAPPSRIAPGRHDEIIVWANLSGPTRQESLLTVDVRGSSYGGIARS